MARAPLVAFSSLILVFLVFAGCTDDPDASELGTGASDPGAPVAGGGPDPGARPNWTHGDWYRYQMYADFGFGALIANSSSELVITEATASGYQVHPSHRDFGIVDAHFNDFFIGAIDPDLNGRSGQDQPFVMFQWPLKDGAEWTSAIVVDPFGEIQDKGITFKADAVADIADPKGTSAGFVVTGKSELGYQVTYTYSAKAKWITEYEKKDPNGVVQLSMKLIAYGGSFKGVIHRVTKEDVYAGVKVMPPVDPASNPPMPGAQWVPGVPDVVTVTKDYTFMQEVVFSFKFGIPPAPASPAIHVQITGPDDAHREYTHTEATTFKFWNRYHEPSKKTQYTVNCITPGFGGAFIGFFGFTDEALTFDASSHQGHGGA